MNKLKNGSQENSSKITKAGSKLSLFMLEKENEFVNSFHTNSGIQQDLRYHIDKKQIQLDKTIV